LSLPEFWAYLDRRAGKRLRCFFTIDDRIQETLISTPAVLEHLVREAHLAGFTAMLCRAGEWTIRTAVHRSLRMSGESSVGTVTLSPPATDDRRQEG
jgi:hypothetical protein